MNVSFYILRHVARNLMQHLVRVLIQILALIHAQIYDVNLSHTHLLHPSLLFYFLYLYTPWVNHQLVILMGACPIPEVVGFLGSSAEVDGEVGCSEHAGILRLGFGFVEL